MTVRQNVAAMFTVMRKLEKFDCQTVKKFDAAVLLSSLKCQRDTS